MSKRTSNWPYSLGLVIYPLVLVWVIPALVGNPPRALQTWPLPARSVVCLGVIGITSLVCPPGARPTLITLLLAIFSARVASTLGASLPVALLVGAPFWLFLLWHARRPKNRPA